MVRSFRALRGPAVDAALWIANAAAVFFITRYLFQMNVRGVYFGWDPLMRSTIRGVQLRSAY